MFLPIITNLAIKAVNDRSKYIFVQFINCNHASCPGKVFLVYFNFDLSRGVVEKHFFKEIILN